jgi:hypothetical protein
MANSPDHLPLEQPASLPTIEKTVSQWCKVNPGLPSADIIRAVQNQLPLYSLEKLNYNRLNTYKTR